MYHVLYCVLIPLDCGRVAADEVLQVLARRHRALRRHQDHSAQDGDVVRLHGAHVQHGEGESHACVTLTSSACELQGLLFQRALTAFDC